MDKVKLVGLKEAYMEIVPEYESSLDEMWKYRLMIRNYFRELNLYTQFTWKNEKINAFMFAFLS